MGAILSIAAVIWIGYAFLSDARWSVSNDSSFEFYFSRYLYPWHVALITGYFYCAERNTTWKYHKKSFFIGLALSIVFMFIYQVIITKRKHLFIRDVITEIAVIFLGYGIELLVDFLSDLSFIFSILTYPVYFAANILLAILPIHLVVWFIPNFILKAMNRASERGQRKTAASGANDSSENGPAFNNVQSMPSVITDKYGQKYRLINMNVYSADYQGMEDSSIITIRNSDIGPAGISAKNSYGYFTW